MIRSTFAIPVILALVTLVGLVSALAGDGWPDVPAWAALALPVAAVGWAWRRRDKRGKRGLPRYPR